MVLLSHPTGNPNVRQALLALYEREMLAEFWTAFRWDSRWALNAVLPGGLRAELGRRSYPQVPQSMVHARPLRELGRLLALRAGMGHLTQRNESFLSVASVYCAMDKAIAKRLGRGRINAVYAYEDGALESFRTARQMGIRTIYELPIAYWKAMHELLEEEAELCPGWANTMPSGRDSTEKTARKDAELELSDLTIVPSQYVKDSLPRQLRESGRIRVCPYGAPPATEACRSERHSKLRVLYVGGLTQRKGLAYLLRALRKVDSLVEVTLIGKRVANCEELDAALVKYRYIPSMPHSQVLAEMERHDVLGFPTLSEGMALVVLEAMSRGMCVVTTPNSGAVGIVRDGIDGFIVPIRSAEGLAAKLELLAGDRDLLQAMRESAHRRAQEYNWERYREALGSAVEEVLKSAKVAGRV
jgi:alpha-maltose-1-phosphate synthase